MSGGGERRPPAAETGTGAGTGATAKARAAARAQAGAARTATAGGGVGLLATAVVLATGAFRGFYWLPVRALAEMGLRGAWGAVAITAEAALLLAPVALPRWRAIRAAGPVAAASVALGGATFALYSVAFVHGAVAVVILLYFPRRSGAR